MSINIKQILSITLIAFFLFLAFASGDETPVSTKDVETNKIVSVDSILQTDYFEIKVNKVSIRKSVQTGNLFANIKSQPGVKFLVFNITFKNIDTESRMFEEGEVLINYNGKDYVFDKSESLLIDGWGAFLEQLNPLTSKKTNLVFKIPEEIEGKIYWKPGRNSSGKMFLLKEIKAKK